MKKVNIEDYDIFKTKQRKNKKIIKKVVTNVMLFVSMYSSVFMLGDYVLKNKDIDDTRIEHFEDEDELLAELGEKTDLSIKDKENQVIFHAVLKNDNLNSDEKELIYNLTDLVNDNPYLDKKSVYNDLKKLDIEYTERPEAYDESVMAVYTYKNNTIYVFEKDNNNNLKIIIHELIHTLYTNENTIKLPKYMIEGVTQLLTDEYFSSTPYTEKNTYPFEITMVKLLCEMVGSEKVLESYTTGNMDIIENELDKVLPKEYNKKFLDNTNTVFDSIIKKEPIKDDCYNEMMDYIDIFCNNKYSYDDELLNIYNYYKNILSFTNTENPYDYYLSFIIDNGVYNKSYFSNNLKNSVNGTYLNTIDQEQEKILVK